MADICVLSNKCFPSFNLDVFDDRNPNSEDDDEKYRRWFRPKACFVMRHVPLQIQFNRKDCYSAPKISHIVLQLKPYKPSPTHQISPEICWWQIQRLLKSTWSMVRAKIGEKLISSSFELSQDHIHIPTCDIGSFGGFLSYLRVPLYHQLNFFRVNWKISSIFRTIITAENCSHRLWVIGSTLTVARL